jgi:hypothetical protein
MSEKSLTPAQRLTDLLFRQNEIYAEVLRDFASRELPGYMQMARAKETLQRAASVMREANSKE